MCDALSWGIMNRDIPKRNLRRGQRIGPLTDDEILAKWGEDADFMNCCGHGALAEYYGISDCSFTHKESHYRIPRPIVKAVNRGKYNRIFQASREWRDIHYRADGSLARYSVLKRTYSSICEVRDNPTLFADFKKILLEDAAKDEQRLTMARGVISLMESRTSEHSDAYEHFAEYPISKVVDRLVHWNDHPEPYEEYNDHVDELVQRSPFCREHLQVYEVDKNGNSRETA